MDILETLQQKKEQKRVLEHPMASLSFHEKYNYCFGLAILAKGNIRTIKDMEKSYNGIAGALGLTKEMSDEMIVDINNHFDAQFAQLIPLLSLERRYAQVFVIDLLLLKRNTYWGQEYCDDVIRQFCYLLQIDTATYHFMEEFMVEAANGNSERAHHLYNDYCRQGGKMDSLLLKYMNPDFYQKQVEEKLELNKGGIFRIENDLEVKNDIIVSKGTRLYINNATLKLGGQLIIEDGRVEITNTSIISTSEKEKDYLIDARALHQLKIRNTQMDCQDNCGAVYQEQGELFLERVTVKNTDKKRGIVFSGNHMVVEECCLMHCPVGGIKLLKNASLDMSQTYFEACQAEHGAGIHISGSGNVHIRECAFQQCTAKYLAPAVYFQYKRYGQQVIRCEVRECSPKQEVFFNVYEYIQ